MPVYDADEPWLTMAIESLIAQLYPRWELCLVDDASTRPHVRPLLAGFAARDARIRLRLLETNEGISGASNNGLALATGEFVGFVDHDDALTEDALYEVVKRLNADPATDFLYTDSDIRDSRGRRVRPFFKPDWSPDLFDSMNYVTHLAVFRRSLVEAVGALRKGFEGSQAYNLMLRVAESARAASRTSRCRSTPGARRRPRSWLSAATSSSTRPTPCCTTTSRRAAARTTRRRTASRRRCCAAAGGRSSPTTRTTTPT
jgi:glycosyltransferase involved in cell wall biosynthesis